MSYKIDQEMIGPAATEDDVIAMVAELRRRGYDVEASIDCSADNRYSGYPNDYIPDSVWMECVETLPPDGGKKMNVYEDNAGRLHIQYNGTWYANYSYDDVPGIAESVRDDDPYDMEPTDAPDVGALTFVVSRGVLIKSPDNGNATRRLHDILEGNTDD